MSAVKSNGSKFFLISRAAFVSSSFVAIHDFQLIRLGRFRTRGAANTSLQTILQPIKALKMLLTKLPSKLERETSFYSCEHISPIIKLCQEVWDTSVRKLCVCVCVCVCSKTNRFWQEKYRSLKDYDVCVCVTSEGGVSLGTVSNPTPILRP